MKEAWTLMERRFPDAAARVRSSAPSKGDSDSWARRCRDPLALLKRWRERVELKEYSAVAVSGLGDGSHVRHLLETLPKGCFLFCGEPDPARARRWVEGPDAARLLRDPRFFFGCGPLDGRFFASMATFPVLDVQDAAPVIFAPEYNRQPDYFSAYFLEFARQVNYWRQLHGTNAVASGVWQENTASNLRLLIEAPDLGQFQGAFKGAEMIVVGAGPSLDESLDYLKSVGDSAVVVAGNSSFRALRNAGVDPHFVMAADPYKWVDKGFEGVDLGRAILVCPFIVFPEAPKRFAGRILTWSQNNLLASFFRLKIGLPLGSRIVEQGTVSACGFDLAQLFGCKRLTFVGQDMAVREDGRSHASDSFYTDLKRNRVDLKGCRRLPGNTLETVPVEAKLYVYLKTFEQMARERRDTLVMRNLSRLGARIEGVPYQSVEEAAAELAASRPPSIGEAWRRVRAGCAPVDRRVGLEREVVAFQQFATRVTRAALRGAITLEQADPRSPEGRDAVRKALAVREELATLLESEPDYHTVLRDGQLKYELLQHTRETRALASTEDPLERECAELKSYFWAVAEGGYRFTLALEQALGEPQAAKDEGSVK